MKNARKKKISTLGFFTILVVIMTLIVSVTFILHDKYGLFESGEAESVVEEA